MSDIYLTDCCLLSVDGNPRTVKLWGKIEGQHPCVVSKEDAGPY